MTKKNEAKPRQELTVFYFEEDDEGGRMGIASAYALGIDSNNQIWTTTDDCAGYVRRMDEFKDSEVKFARNKNITIKDPIIQQLLCDRAHFEWKAGESCYAGAGNFGICFGQLSMLVED